MNLVADFPRVLATLIDRSFVLVHPSTTGARDDTITVLALAPGKLPPGTPNWHPVLTTNSPKIDTPC